MIRRAALLAALVAATGAAALDLPANARLTAERVTTPDRYDAPVAPFDGETIPVQSIEGQIVRRAWRIPGVTPTPLQVLAPLRAQLQEAGYRTVLDCHAARCGGFDFRFGIEVLPAPAMFVNLRDYHFVTMRKGREDRPAAMVTLLVSTGTDTAHVQIIEARRDGAAGVLPVEAPEGPDRPPEPAVAAPAGVPGDDKADRLMTRGFLVLEGLDFETGATALGPGPFPVLGAVAEFLTDHPDLRIALVGHTDTVGPLDENIEISRARARAVRRHLIDAYGIEAGRLDAEGMGYLAPRASNLSEAGREANRRVEAVVLTTQ